MRTTVRPVAARVSAAPDILDWVRGLVSLAFVLLLPLLIIGTSLRGLVTDRDLMLRGFRDNQVATTTGLDDPQLQRIADALVAYFQGPPGQIQMQVTAFGQSRPLFNAKERTDMLAAETKGIAKSTGTSIEIVTFSNLAVDAAAEHAASVIFRGLRDGADFDYEMQMAGMNGAMAPGIQTVFVAASPGVRHIAANLVRQIALMGGDASAFVSPAVAQRLKAKAKTRR